MNPGRYTIKTFFNYQNLEQVLIPEIQRDYVWKKENMAKLLQSILEDFETKLEKDAAITPDFLKKLPKQAREFVVRGLEQQKVYSNIGFIYAYFDSEQLNKYMLIDGQQRLTSVYLILLYLYIREGRQDRFRKSYFINERPKIDYKVRENAHVFFVGLIRFLLDGGDILQIKEQYWYYHSYRNDATINSLIENYTEIAETLDDRDLTADFMEDQVEFWYFDTSKSEQGEDLYLYMNSRGETVQSNENIKAELLEKQSEQDKNKWGSLWEEWQHFFWINKGASPNADRGFDEFLRWIKIIGTVRKKNYSKTLDLTDDIKSLRESPKFDKQGLDLDTLSDYFQALQRLIAFDLGRYFNIDLVKSQPTTLAYVRLLPLLFYAKSYPQATHLEIVRYARFFFNISRFDNVSKSPYPHIGQAIQLTDDLVKAGYTDVTDLTRFKQPGIYDNILTAEELQKLLMYDTDMEITRDELEGLFWNAEDFVLCDGRIGIIWHCMNYNYMIAGRDKFSKSAFVSFFETFKTLFATPDDQLRRALLTKGDYAVSDGYSTSLGADRWSFGSGAVKWREILHDEIKKDYLKGLLTDYLRRARKDKQLTKRDILQAIIDDHLAKDRETNWLHYFIADHRILQYCTNKLVCFADETVDGIYLLQSKLAVANMYLPLRHYVKKKAAAATKNS